MDIHIESIPHHTHRYPTVGDWFKEDGKWVIKVSQTGDWRMDFLVGLHEQIEMALCEARGIKEEDVMAHDLHVEELRDTFEMHNEDLGEPGDWDSAPYRDEHRFAENIERQVALALGVDWKAYERVLEDLDNAGQETNEAGVRQSTTEG